MVFLTPAFLWCRLLHAVMVLDLQRLCEISEKLSPDMDRQEERLSSDPNDHRKTLWSAAVPGGTRQLRSSGFKERSEPFSL